MREPVTPCPHHTAAHGSRVFHSDGHGVPRRLRTKRVFAAGKRHQGKFPGSRSTASQRRDSNEIIWIVEMAAEEEFEPQTRIII